MVLASGRWSCDPLKMSGSREHIGQGLNLDFCGDRLFILEKYILPDAENFMDL